MPISKKHTYYMAFATILTAFGILLPMYMPLKLILEPMSFTLASHVPIFIAMFISPLVAVLVCIGTTVGFLIAGFAPVIWLRALSHLGFSIIGALWIQKNPDILNKKSAFFVFALVVGMFHATLEIFVVFTFYKATGIYASDIITTLFLLVGLGSMAHSLIDAFLARIIWEPIKILLKK